MPGFVTAQPPRREDRSHAQPRAGASSAPSMASMARTGLSGRLERRPQGGVEPARTCPALRWKISRRAVVGIQCRPATKLPGRTPRRDKLSQRGPRADADQTGPEAASRRTGCTKPRRSGGGGSWAEAASGREKGQRPSAPSKPHQRRHERYAGPRTWLPAQVLRRLRRTVSEPPALPLGRAGRKGGGRSGWTMSAKLIGASGNETAGASRPPPVGSTRTPPSRWSPTDG